MKTLQTEGSGAESRDEVAGLWRRTVAFGIDGLVLGLIGLAIAILFFDQLAAIGSWGRLIGFLIGLSYFSIMEGFDGRCQSLGKQAMKIKVVRCGASGVGTLNMTQAGARYAIIAIPNVLGGIGFVDLPALNSPTMAWLPVVNSFVVFLWDATLLYLLVFNRPYRQSLHDLAVSSIVVRESVSHVRGAPVRALHWSVLGAFALFLMIASPFVNRYAASKLTGPYAIQRVTLAIPGVRQSSVTTGSSRRVGSVYRTPTTVTTIVVFVSDPMLQTERGVAAIAKAAFSALPILAKQDIVTIACVRAVDLGIATWRTQFGESWPGTTWESKLGSRPGVSDR
ncbi:RDD family protein [Paraburkholderia hospita]|jgi:uncharacterized RDD family membrane protein YckC|uniref:RDD family protein n=1 Tax=Paraburkholderia hospita TaxID=169430 RepID=UPI00137500BA|nr:RDD family protein [Paraburkholderia hospita]